MPGSGDSPDMPRPPDQVVFVPENLILGSGLPAAIVEKNAMPAPPLTGPPMKMTLGKAPKPLKPKPFQKVLNTIPMPMRIKNIPFKPVGEPRQPKNPVQSPTRKPVPPVLQSIEKSPG